MVSSLLCASPAIRRAQASDLAEVAVMQRTAILALAVANYGVAGAEAWARWQAVDAQNLLIHAGAAFVAEDQVRGIVAVGSWRPDAQAIEVAWVRAVFVSPDSARRGIGKSIMAKVEESAGTADRPVLRLVASENARAFYQAIGYKAVEARFWEIDPGLVLSCTLMEKPAPAAR